MSFTDNFLVNKQLAGILNIGSSGNCQHVFHHIISDRHEFQDIVEPNVVLVGNGVDTISVFFTTEYIAEWAHLDFLSHQDGQSLCGA